MSWMRAACLILGVLIGTAQARADEAPQGYSAAGLYNLGNSYARAGKPGLAILNYERASLLAPNDPDVEANLQFVRQAAHLPPEAPSALGSLSKIGTPFVMAGIGILGIAVLGASILAIHFSRRLRRLRLVGVIAGVLMIAATVGCGVSLWPKLHAGVIIGASTAVRVSPVPMGDSLFVLKEGELVHIDAEHEGFTLIRSSAGRSGWVANSSLAPIVPQ